MSDCKILPLGNRVVVEVEEVSETTAGGLIIPPTAQGDEAPDVGKVIRLGMGTDDHKFSVEVGDTVYFSKYAPDKIELDGNTYLVIDEEKILAVVK